jgi:hypothetical protein
MAPTHNIPVAASHQIASSALLVKRLPGKGSCVIDYRHGLIMNLYDEEIIMVSTLMKILVTFLEDTSFSRLHVR